MNRPFKVVNWCGVGQKLVDLGYDIDIEERATHKHDESKSIWEVAKDIYDSGLNVMIRHQPNDEFDFLAVDDRRFGQR